MACSRQLLSTPSLYNQSDATFGFSVCGCRHSVCESGRHSRRVHRGVLVLALVAATPRLLTAVLLLDNWRNIAISLIDGQ
jgi:hypothetical protein